MGLVHSRTDSGLIVAELGSDGAAVRRALKEYDPQLELLPPGVDVRGGADRQHWRVYARTADDRPMLFITAWCTRDGDPLPLSMRLLDKVKEQDRNTRSAYADEDTRNARLRARRAEDSRVEGEALVDEHLRFRGKTFPAPRSVALRMTRDKLRAKGKKV